MASKKMTIEDLARITKKGFDETVTRVQFDNLDKRLIRVEEKLDNIEKILLKQQGEQIKNLDRRVNRLEEMFAVNK